MIQNACIRFTIKYFCIISKLHKKYLNYSQKYKIESNIFNFYLLIYLFIYEEVVECFKISLQIYVGSELKIIIKIFCNFKIFVCNF